MDTNIAFSLQDWILSVFNKEGIAVFAIFSSTFFLLAGCLAYWAFKSGQFDDIEAAKFEMMGTGV
ncbi:MAG: cbb3-type cytochrome oxidase assembly protein CcoS [Cyanobacteria bacterium]|nr:cbb3-type cytochrome oxidase assembly protein CcoS [Cyanobacteriota bacterium]